MVTSTAHSLARDELVRVLTVFSGVTTSDGAEDGTTLIDSSLIGRNDFISEKTILIVSGDAKDEDKGAASFDKDIGEITLQGTGFSDKIVAGTIYRILNISSTEIDVARIEAKVDTIDTVVDDIQTILNHASYGVGAIKNYMVNTLTAAHTAMTTIVTDIQTILNHASYGVGAIKNYLTGTVVGNATYGLTALGVIVTDIQTILNHASYGVGAIKNYMTGTLTPAHAAINTIVTNIQTIVEHGTYGLGAIRNLLVHATYGLQALYNYLVAIRDRIDAVSLVPARTASTTTLSGFGTEDVLYNKTDTNPFFVPGVWLGLENMAAGDVIRFRAYRDWDDASILDVISDDELWTFGGAQTPKWVYKPLNIYCTYEFKVTGETLAGTDREVYCEIYDAQRGS